MSILPDLYLGAWAFVLVTGTAVIVTHPVQAARIAAEPVCWAARWAARRFL